jgi:hypothetical protein
VHTFVMTKVTDEGQERRSRCQWCRRVLPAQTTGRPRKFCSQACRQWHWVGQQRARELELREGELLVTTAELDELHDQLYVLACAVNDVEQDLRAAGPTANARALRETLDWLLEAARPLRDRETIAHPSGSSVQRP